MFGQHYSSELFKHVADLLSNTKLLGNPTKIFSNLVEVWVSNFKENKSLENDPFSKKIFKESFITLFQAHSKATGNFEMNYYQHLMKPDALKKYAPVTQELGGRGEQPEAHLGRSLHAADRQADPRALLRAVRLAPHADEHARGLLGRGVQVPDHPPEADPTPALLLQERHLDPLLLAQGPAADGRRQHRDRKRGRPLLTRPTTSSQTTKSYLSPLRSSTSSPSSATSPYSTKNSARSSRCSSAKKRRKSRKGGCPSPNQKKKQKCSK